MNNNCDKEYIYTLGQCIMIFFKPTNGHVCMGLGSSTDFCLTGLLPPVDLSDMQPLIFDTSHSKPCSNQLIQHLFWHRQ